MRLAGETECRILIKDERAKSIIRRLNEYCVKRIDNPTCVILRAIEQYLDREEKRND